MATLSGVVETLTRELKWSARRLARTPAPTLAALVVLTLGIGSTVTVYTVVRAVLLKELPLENSDALVVVERHDAASTSPMHSPADLLDFRQTNVFSSLSASGGFRSLVTGTLEPAYVAGASVTPEYFETLGAHPILGQTLLTWRDQPNTVVLSWQTWQTLLGGDRNVLNKTILLDREPYRIVGVMAKDLAFLNTDLWIPGPQGLPRPPFAVGPALTVRRDLTYIRILGRLAPAWKLAAARAAVDRVGREIIEKYPASYADVRFTIRPFREFVVGDRRDQLLILSMGVGLVFLLVALSVAGLLVGRSISRLRDDEVRLALGANRFRALAGTLTDSLLLATLGGMLGTIASIWGVRFLLSLAPPLPWTDEVSLDRPILLFAFGATLAASLLASVLPSVAVIRSQSGRVLVSSGRRSQGRGQKRAWTALMFAEFGLMVLLLVGSLTLNRRLLTLRAIDLGFKPEGLLVASFELPDDRYPTPTAIAGFFDDLLDRLQAHPEIEAVGAAMDVPMFEGKIGLPFSIVGQAADPGSPPPVAWFSAVSPGYFRTLHVRIRTGRGFDAHDRAGATQVAIVNEAMARLYWRSHEPLGERLKFADGTVAQIVGTVSDVRHSPFEIDPEPRVYRPYAQHTWPAMSVIVRGRANVPQLMPFIGRTVRELDPGQPLPAMALMEDSVREFLRPTRFLLLIVGGFAFLAVAIAGVGLYALLSFRVQDEEHDLAIHLALGAAPSVLARRQLLRGCLVAGAGAAMGTAVALPVASLLKEILPVIGDTQASLLLLAVLVSLTIGGLSSLLPALHVLSLDPSRANKDAY